MNSFFKIKIEVSFGADRFAMLIIQTLREQRLPTEFVFVDDNIVSCHFTAIGFDPNELLPRIHNAIKSVSANSTIEVTAIEVTESKPKSFHMENDEIVSFQ